jgi:hypothetical protein
LSGAKCRGLHRIFTEPETTDDISDAETLCGFCPALPQCANWYESLPNSQKPKGCIIAGQWRPERPTTKENSMNHPAAPLHIRRQTEQLMDLHQLYGITAGQRLRGGGESLQQSTIRDAGDPA